MQERKRERGSQVGDFAIETKPKPKYKLEPVKGGGQVIQQPLLLHHPASLSGRNGNNKAVWATAFLRKEEEKVPPSKEKVKEM